MRSRLPFAIAMLALTAASANAQVIRGVITDRTSSAPVAGVLVWLDLATGPPADARTRAVAAVLSDERGQYAIRAPEPGRYRLSAKRIGVQRFTSDPFIIGLGETSRMDLALDPVSYALPKVVVTGQTLCSRTADAERIASLWDEARTALTAAQISLRDRLFHAQLTRYMRSVEPRTLRVLEESRTELEGFLDRPFTSLSGDSLSKVGYWSDIADDSTSFHAPDADVLLSEAFLRDHCFTAVEGGRDRRDLVGLGFQPRRGRDLPDVRGTIWLDARSFELRSVEFRYTKLPPAAEAAGVGGEVHFARLPSGAWIVRRWFIRMPQYAQDRSTRTPVVTVPSLLEAGGNVFAAGIPFFGKPAAVTGVVFDSVGAPFAGATVRLAGTPLRTTLGADGRFHFDSLPAGSYTVLAEHEGYASLGLAVADQPVRLEEGATGTVTLRAVGTARLVSLLCGGKRVQAGRATLRVTLVDSATSAPLGALEVWLHWVDYSLRGATPEATGRGAQSMTDLKGSAVFCDVPSLQPLELMLIRSNGQKGPILGQFRLDERTVTARTVLIGQRR